MGPSDLVTLACCVVVVTLSPQLVSCNRQPPHDDHVKFKSDENYQDQQQSRENGGAGSVRFDTKTVAEEETSRNIDYQSCNADVPEASVAAALEHVQPYEDVSLGGSLKRFINGVLRWVYEAITYDFCKVMEVDPSFDDVKTVIPLPPTKLAVVKEDPKKVEVPAKTSALSGLKASLVSWWKRPTPQKGLTDPSYRSRVGCFLRRARNKMYQDKKTHPSIWSPTDVCGTLCESCECNHDPNSTCAKELLVWRTQTKPLLFWTYAVLHRSRLLCAFGLLQSVLRKKYIYKTVMCMPLLILFFVLSQSELGVLTSVQPLHKKQTNLRMETEGVEKMAARGLALSLLTVRKPNAGIWRANARRCMKGMRRPCSNPVRSD
ncbi:hypothetical protein HPB47_026082 [Ixodes persulcatus]|uniref:Uncharacterized protein n=1 Tax=Ixodes persulcatus TaxID=34615 RepID=A0AC60PZN4_IXOPE|nr:hypothetical protein HPB47_026082 [Ixodes persulcatus]